MVTYHTREKFKKKEYKLYKEVGTIPGWAKFLILKGKYEFSSLVGHFQPGGWNEKARLTHLASSQNG